jgi:uncharacterized RDD family membrane protein YckC
MTDATSGAAEPSAVRYAGFWRRVLAYIIDAILIGVLYGIIGTAFGVAVFDPAMLESASPEDIAGMAATANLISVIMILLIWVYYAGCEMSGLQGTPGKMALGLKVTDLRGNRIGFGRASIRFWGKFVSAIILCIGYLMVAFTAKKQGLHDMMAGCLVVRK